MVRGTLQVVKLERSFGILLHPTSLPGPWGIGKIGREARAFVDWLAQAGARWWQVLPLGPTGYGDSPYQSFSAFAGNPYLIDPEWIFARGWLEREDPPAFPQERVDYGWVYSWTWPFLRRAYQGFEARAGAADRRAWNEFREAEASWLEDYALFMAFKERFGGQPWSLWPAEVRSRQPAALRAAQQQLAGAVRFHAWTQWAFFRLWGELRAYAAARGIRIIGDIPIFVAYDSADVWAHPEYFYLDAQGRPTVVAGVPPDYFSPTGQRWGNPLYRWDALEAEGFQWWIDRIRHALKTCDLLRIDHFRGFQAYWEIPAEEPTAVHGRWVEAPGDKLFTAVGQALGQAPILAEDLGVITPEVEALRDKFGFPGMKVLQFAFGGRGDNPHLPHNYPADRPVVVYTGTHDNDTALGWYHTASDLERGFLRGYLACHGIEVAEAADVPWALIDLAFRSRAVLAMVPLQDVLGLGSEGRMNTPARPAGNWAWRYRVGELTEELARRLREQAAKTGRLHLTGGQAGLY